MTPEELDAAAKALWDAAPMRQGCPPWENLGDVTRSVWHERAMLLAEQCPLDNDFGDLA